MSIVTRIGSIQTFNWVPNAGTVDNVISTALAPAGRNRVVVLSMHLTDASNAILPYTPIIRGTGMTEIVQNPSTGTKRDRLFSWCYPVEDTLGSELTITISRNTLNQGAAAMIVWYENVYPNSMFQASVIAASTTTAVVASYTPADATNDLTVAFGGWNEASVTSFIQAGEGTVISSSSQLVGSINRESAIALIEAPGEAVADFAYSVTTVGGNIDGNFNARINSWAFNHVDIETVVGTVSVQTWGSQISADTVTTAFSTGTAKHRALVVFGVYTNNSSLSDTPPQGHPPTFGNIPMTEIARPVGGTSSAQLIAWVTSLSDNSVGSYDLVCSKDSLQDTFHGVGFLLSNCSALPSRISVSMVQALSNARLGFPALIQPASYQSDLVLAAATIGSGSTVTLYEDGDGTEVISNQTAGGGGGVVFGGTGFYIQNLSVTSSQGASNLSMHWTNVSGVSERWRTIALTIPVAGIEIPLGTGSGAYYMRRRAMNVY